MFGTFELQQEAKRLESREQAGEGKSGPREESWDLVTDGLIGPGQAFTFYSKLVRSHWKVSSRVSTIFIFPPMYHSGNSS